jgi:hypothetical protein
LGLRRQKYFAVRQNKNARQSILFAVRGEKKLPPFCAHGSALGANEGGGGGDGS